MQLKPADFNNLNAYMEAKMIFHRTTAEQDDISKLDM